ncbi:phosphonate ABC transporter, permease protein PhnE [Salipaludibacillus keqinensis]|uniref:Phosphonate ABC transporter, permease protein PhnE n=1 Tax=Salipaludibacillus keqinensis TaxID=2045207 RepID=A0A323TEJ4_9BACI|nr:phosphonate ABC transporter, permease protein PhnE [Salipaludibacillus keqinensis]PYZ93471.1 phosphonate ABC transporter, permease protein PhnE [Salipaludibacillus keqinensis]
MVWFRKRLIVYVLFIAIAIWFSAVTAEFSFVSLFRLENTWDFIQRNFWPLRWELVPYLLQQSLITLSVAFLGTLVALCLALPISFLAASNTSVSKAGYYAVRSSLSLVRSVPEIVFGLIFVVSLGLGPFAALLAIFLHNVGVLGKLISELIEAAESGPQEAMKSVGSSRRIGQIFSIIPQIWPNVLSHYFYRFEVAIRTSLVLGMIGGGGLGQSLMNYYNSLAYEAMATAISIIMILVIVVDVIGGIVRKRVI